jgi:chromosome segregation ATPase
VTGLFGQFAENFRKGRDAAYVERGFRQGAKPAPDSEATETEAESGNEATDNSLVNKLAETVKTLKKSNGELEAERDEANKLLREVADEATGHKQRIETLEGELADQKKQNKKLRGENTAKTKLIDKLSATVKALQSRAGELEAERDTLAAPLKIPGMKRVLSKVVHEDSHKDRGPLTDDQRRELTEWSQAVNAAFALIKRLTTKPDETEQ